MKNNKPLQQPKTRYQCSIHFTLSKNLKKVFSEKKFLRIITLNNMVEGKNNIYIIRDNDDIEAEIGDLQLDCLPEGKSAENNAILLDKIKSLELENKALKSKLEKIGKLLAN
ncbi:MAG: hypothetical protein K0R49_1588 [Burkholderiales bacterium]|jgi:hypothetical protein|nr:hypothetical protein [Burkholderiales bacterium]MCE3269336.1 hypothetical protein [Burkholderiales bacterium]